MAKILRSDSNVSVFENILPSKLLGEVQGTLGRLTQEEGLEKLYRTGRCGISFWYPLEKKPQSVFERLIRHLHRAARIPKSCKGGEWWFNIRPSDASMHGHFDKDEAELKRSGEFRHPVRSSVLYLTDCGAPTLIYKVKSTEFLQYCKTGKLPYESYFIPPRLNRYAVFDGNLYHGSAYVENAFTRVDLSPDQPRIVLAVNWWRTKPGEPYCVDYDPMWGERFQDAIMALSAGSERYRDNDQEHS